MVIDIKVPEAGESITQVELARWLVQSGQYVEKDQEIAEIDSDKATLTINAEAGGVISIGLEEGSSTEPGAIIGTIDTSAPKPEPASDQAARSDQAEKPPATAPEPEKPGGEQPDKAGAAGQSDQKEAITTPDGEARAVAAHAGVTITPQAKKLLDELQLDPGRYEKMLQGNRITKKDILLAIAGAAHDPKETTPKQAASMSDMAAGSWGGSRNENRQKMSTLRRKIAERLVAVKNQTAMLTTFNEADMSAIMAVRRKYQDAFVKAYGIKLGFMSFFVKAVAESIPFYPQVNGYIEDDYIVTPEYADIGIAVSTPKGLMVPVIRQAESMTLAQLEQAIQEMANRARDNKISLEELKGGTISITNGGVFGSMLSTPIINPPQSAILGMHNIIERPVAINGEVVIRPMMYLALSYDHRIVDGRESVGFLVKVKEMIENPLKLLAGGHDPETMLLGL